MGNVTFHVYCDIVYGIIFCSSQNSVNLSTRETKKIPIIRIKDMCYAFNIGEGDIYRRLVS
jgi:hypothetical protein